MNQVLIRPQVFEYVRDRVSVNNRTKRENITHVYETFLWHGLPYLVNGDLNKSCYWMYIKQKKGFAYPDIPESTIKYYMRLLIKHHVIEIEKKEAIEYKLGYKN